MLQALIFDVDGTLADTEAEHQAAFNRAFDELGLGWHWDEARYTELLQVSGGKERVLHYWQQQEPELRAIDGLARFEVVQRIHELKTAHYEARINAGAVELRPGVLRLMDQALGQGLALAIATTTSPVNVAALLRGAIGTDWRLNFAVVADASTAPIKKPHPQVYLQVLAALQRQPMDCLAFEDSGNGLQAAVAAGLSTIVTPTRFTAQHDFHTALRVLPDLGGVDLHTLAAWHAPSTASASRSRPSPAQAAARA